MLENKNVKDFLEKLFKKTAVNVCRYENEFYLCTAFERTKIFNIMRE